MRRTRGRVIDVDSLQDFDRKVEAGADDLAGWRICGVDLRERGETLDRASSGGATFVDCLLSEAESSRLQSRGAVVLGGQATPPVDPTRQRLYTPAELYDTSSYRTSLDARAYAWGRGGPSTDPERSRVEALHDHAIDEALREWITGRRLVGVMGGHALRRGKPAYAAGARLGHALGSSLTVATGGGPGAMEAANLGAALADHSAAEVESAVEALGRTPSFRPSIDAWVRSAFDVLDEHGGTDVATPSLGIPTWH